MIRSVGLEGMSGYEVLVEADVRNEKEQCVIVGLPDASIKESKERILSNLHLLNGDISMKKNHHSFISFRINVKSVWGMTVRCSCSTSDGVGEANQS